MQMLMVASCTLVKIGKTAREKIQTSAEILEKIVAERSLKSTHLHLLIERIYIKQAGEGLLDIEFALKMPFKSHLNINEVLVYSYNQESEDKSTCGLAS